MRDLLIRITGDNTSAKQALRETDDSIDGLGKTSDKATKTMEASWRKLGAAIGAAVSVRAIADMAGQITESAGRVNDLAAKMGIGAEAVQELKFAAEQSGGSIEQVASALALMGDKLTDGKDGTVDALSRLGLTLDSLRASSPDQAFTAIATAIGGIADPMQRSNIAMELFGRSGTNLLPLLTSDIAGLRQQAIDMGAVISNDLVAKGDELGDSWDAMRARVEGVRTRALLPVFESFMLLPQPMQTAIGLGSEFATAFGGIATALMLIPGVGAAVGSALATVGGGLLALATGPVGITVAAVGGLWLAWKVFGDDLMALVESIYSAVKTWLWDKFEPVLTPIIPLLQSIGDMFDAFGKLVGAVFGKIVELTVDAVRDVLMWLSDRLMPVFRPIGAAIEAVAAVFGRAYTAITGFVTNIYTSVRTWLLDRFTSIVDGVKGKIDAVTGFFRNMYDAVVGNSFVPDMINGIGLEFARLPDVMVTPAQLATSAVSGAFRDTSNIVTNEIGRLVSAAQGGMDGLKQYGEQFAVDFVSSILDTFVPGLGQIFQQAWPLIKAQLDLIWSGIKSFFSWVWDGLKALGRGFMSFFGGHYTYGGGEEDERRRREEDNQYFPDNPYYQPPSGEGTGNPYTPFASGGIVTRPTMGLVGEAGPEAIIPLKNWSGMGGATTINVDARGAFFPDRQSMQRLADLLIRQLPGAASVYVTR